MKLKDLVNTCQNQFKGLFGRNSDFRLVVVFEYRSNKKEEQEVILDSYYFDNEKYLLDLRSREVLYWEMRYKDNLYVEVEGAFIND